MEKDGLIYSPPAWKVCEVCGGAGLSHEYDGMKDIVGACKTCNGTGRIPIRYNPEQWQEAGGVLDDDTPVRVKHDGEWIILAEYGDFKHTKMTMVIATEAGWPPEGYVS